MTKPTDALSYWDEQSQCHIIATTPTKHPRLWDRFLGGAQESYARHGVSTALEMPVIRDGHTTALFFAALDRSGDVLGGVRAQGPYTTAEQSHALLEFAGHAEGRSRMHTMLVERVQHGVVELKSAWVAPHAPHAREVAAMIAESPAYSTALLGARYALATAASHVRAAWLRTGAVIATHIEAIPYPDDRYRTEVFWWDRTTLASEADVHAWRKMRRNTLTLLSHGQADAHQSKAVAS